MSKLNESRSQIDNIEINIVTVNYYLKIFILKNTVNFKSKHMCLINLTIKLV